MSDWIKWEGGECPLEPSDRVEIKMMYGGVLEGNARAFRWQHLRNANNDLHAGNIIAYRKVRKSFY